MQFVFKFQAPFCNVLRCVVIAAELTDLPVTDLSVKLHLKYVSLLMMVVMVVVVIMVMIMVVMIMVYGGDDNGGGDDGGDDNAGDDDNGGGDDNGDGDGDDNGSGDGDNDNTTLDSIVPLFQLWRWPRDQDHGYKMESDCSYSISFSSLFIMSW